MSLHSYPKSKGVHSIVPTKCKQVVYYAQDINHDDEDAILQLSRSLGNAWILRKGAVDIACDGSLIRKFDGHPASPRRCGGQGDILAGMLATFLFRSLSG